MNWAIPAPSLSHSLSSPVSRHGSHVICVMLAQQREGLGDWRGDSTVTVVPSTAHFSLFPSLLFLPLSPLTRFHTARVLVSNVCWSVVMSVNILLQRWLGLGLYFQQHRGYWMIMDIFKCKMLNVFPWPHTIGILQAAVRFYDPLTLPQLQIATRHFDLEGHTTP